MKRTLLGLLAVVVIWTGASAVRAADEDAVRIDPKDWPWWRGPGRNGIAADQRVPVEWSETKNVIWKAPVPGRIGAIRCAVGDTVPAGAILVEIAPAEVEEKP